jgi:hypothetical protein
VLCFHRDHEKGWGGLFLVLLSAPQVPAEKRQKCAISSRRSPSRIIVRALRVIIGKLLQTTFGEANRPLSTRRGFCCGLALDRPTDQDLSVVTRQGASVSSPRPYRTRTSLLGLHSPGFTRGYSPPVPPGRAPAVRQTLAGGSHGLGCGPCARKKAQGVFHRAPSGTRTPFFAAYPGLRFACPGLILLRSLRDGHLRCSRRHLRCGKRAPAVWQTLAGGSHGL